MSDSIETTGPDTGASGQAETAPQGTTVDAPADASGQAAPSESNDSFFDHASLAPELQTAYKQMQASYTKKMQGISTQRKELESVASLKTAFERDPHGVLANLATQYGYKLTPAQQAALASQQEDQPGEWQPQSWDEVLKKANETTRRELLNELAPILETVKKSKAESVEAQLDQIDPLWRDYEDQMTGLLQKHPTLSGDLATLYELAVPKEKRESQYMQKALAKVRAIGNAGAVSGPSTKPRAVATAPVVTNFNEAVAAAKLKLANGGN